MKLQHDVVVPGTEIDPAILCPPGKLNLEHSRANNLKCQYAKSSDNVQRYYPQVR